MNRKIQQLKYCKIVQERRNYNAIYYKDNLLTHFKTWRKAVKIGKLFDRMYECGYKVAEEDYRYFDKI